VIITFPGIGMCPHSSPRYQQHENPMNHEGAKDREKAN